MKIRKVCRLHIQRRNAEAAKSSRFAGRATRYEFAEPENKYGFRYFDKLTEPGEEEEEEEDEYEAHSCSDSCCDQDCECDDCIRCANTGLIEADSYAEAAAAA